MGDSSNDTNGGAGGDSDDALRLARSLDETTTTSFLQPLQQPQSTSTTTTTSTAEGPKQQNQQQQQQRRQKQHRGRHHKVQSWGGAISGFASNLFGGGGGSGSNRPPRPPPPPSLSASITSSRDGARFRGSYSSSEEEEECHRRNQQFLQQARQQHQSTFGSSPNKQHFASPSPNTRFRKNLQLKAIEEDDGQQSFVVVKSIGSGPQQQAQPEEGGGDDNQSQVSAIHRSIRFQDNDQPDDMSSLGGDYYNSSGRSPNSHANFYPPNSAATATAATTTSNPPLTTAAPHNGTTTTSMAASSTSKFEQQLEERFQQQKQEMERKLHLALKQQQQQPQQSTTTPATNETTTSLVIQEYMEELERERSMLLTQWKTELQQEQERIRTETSRHRLLRDCYDAIIQPIVSTCGSVWANAEVVLSNMPLTIGAVGLSWVTQGVVWFKFTEEMTNACEHVHYFSDQCSFQEFPGCFECDRTDPYYKLAVNFHWFCSGISATACVLFLIKVVLAPQAVLDMLNNPTTSTPIGVFCIAMVCTFAGQYGWAGEVIVLVMSCFHVLLAFWFFYMAFWKFRLMPDPGWFPNIVGISYAAVKTWIYFPDPGLVLMTLCIVFFLGTFFISVVRVALNHKIAAPVCWIQLSAPSITLYAMTLISQPTPREETQLESSQAAKESYHQFLETFYLPSQHLFMALTMVGLVSAVHSLHVRWPTFKNKPFSPAHVAFCFPTLSHTNAIQAYRASLDALSSIPPGSLFKKILFGYWCLFLVSGTILNIVFTIKYVLRIPEWTKPNVTGEEAPPAPANTIVHEMMDETGAHETMRQPFVSPAVLEASEAGVLVRVKRGTEDYRLHGPFVRTRNVTSLGFDLMLSELELREERARLLDWVAKNAPRKRNKTLSVPGIMHLRNKNDGGDVYGTFTDHLSQAETLRRGHARSKTTTGTSFV